MATLGSPPWTLLCTLMALLAALWCAGRALAGAWLLRPLRVARALRSRASGTPYRFPSGDVKDYVRLVAASCSQPMPLSSYAVAARVAPFDHGVIKEHGKVALTWFSREPRVVVSDPGLFREILSNKQGHFGKQKSMLRIERLMANGLTAHQGDKWAAHRRIINHAFHLDKLKRMLPAFAACSSELVGRWGNSLGQGDAREIDVWPEFQNLTGDVISRVAFGSSFSEGRKIFRLQSEQAQSAVKLANVTMTTDDIAGELKLFYFAGMETTAVLLTWAIVVLSMHHEWQDPAREEVLRVFGKNLPDSEGINQLKVVTMLLHAVLRLYPPIPLHGREAYKEAEPGGVAYPAGITFALPIVCIHHDPDVWGEDVDEFKPERFVEGIAGASKNSPAFFPLGWGPRICVGQNYALLEAKMGLSVILQHFIFELSPSYTHVPYLVSTLQPQHGAPIKLMKL